MQSMFPAMAKGSVGFLGSVILITCCGCPPASPSQEEQRQAVTSRWITVDAKAQQGETRPQLDQDDLNRIVNGVPTISTVVVERVKTGSIETEHHVTEASVCGTTAEYLRLLEEGARAKVQLGRFFSAVEAAEGAAMIVLSDNLAKTLFAEADAIDRKVLLEGQELTVVGVMSDGAQWGASVTRDAYVPLKLFGSGSDQSAPFAYDRFRFRVRSLDQVKPTQAIIQKIFEKHHPDQSIRVRSGLSLR